jgi:hypothetical protein
MVLGEGGDVAASPQAELPMKAEAA